MQTESQEANCIQSCVRHMSKWRNCFIWESHSEWLVLLKWIKALHEAMQFSPFIIPKREVASSSTASTTWLIWLAQKGYKEQELPVTGRKKALPSTRVSLLWEELSIYWLKTVLKANNSMYRIESLFLHRYWQSHLEVTVRLSWLLLYHQLDLTMIKLCQRWDLHKTHPRLAHNQRKMYK